MSRQHHKSPADAKRAICGTSTTTRSFPPLKVTCLLCARLLREAGRIDQGDLDRIEMQRFTAQRRGRPSSV